MKQFSLLAEKNHVNPNDFRSSIYNPHAYGALMEMTLVCRLHFGDRFRGAILLFAFLQALHLLLPWRLQAEGFW